MKQKHFKFYIKDNKYILKSNNFRIVLKKPMITGYDDYSKIDKEQKENNIMYYYYTIELYKKIRCYNEKTDSSKNKWIRVASKYTHDFPTIEQLQYMVNYILECNPIEDGQKHTYRSGNVEYSETIHTEGFGCDDFYEITKYVNEKGEPTNYIFYVGCAIDPMVDLESVGIRTPYVSHLDMLELKKFVDGFINYSIDSYNRNIDKMVLRESLNKEIVDDKLYFYDNNEIFKNESGKYEIKKDRIDSIFMVGDFLNITYLIDTNDKSREKTKNINLKLIGLDKEKSSIVGHRILNYDSDTYEIFGLEEKPITILLKDIYFITKEATLEERHFDIEEVTNDFYNILNENEMKEFNQMSEEELFQRYHSAIINRTWMCWIDTHKFPNLTNKTNPSNIDVASEITKVVIKKIKEKVKNR